MTKSQRIASGNILNSEDFVVQFQVLADREKANIEILKLFLSGNSLFD